MAGNNSYFKLREELAEFDKKYEGSDDVFGLTQLTFPGYSSSPRLVMFAGAHIKQTVPQLYPDFPRVYTGRENVFGMLSSGYKKTHNNLTVLYKVPRFSNMPNHLYTLFCYDEDNDSYCMIEKKNLEDLTEVYGYSYNTEVLDSYDVGDTIPDDTMLYKSCSYDEYNNYCNGKNTLVMYTADPLTIEDAIKARKGYADQRVSTEVETITCMLNDNDILGNYYGNKKEYHPFPHIGEKIKDQIICFKKRVINSQILYDFKENNMRKVNFALDTPYYVNGGGVVDDIFIYSNKSIDEIPDTSFYKDIKNILIEQERYFKEVNAICKEFIESGKKVSRDINHLFKRSSEILEPEYKWREEKSIYSNMIIEFQIYRPNKIKKGSKTTGRLTRLFTLYNPCLPYMVTCIS